MPEPNADTESLNDAALALAAAYDPSDPNLVGMMIPHDGELREIVDAAIVDGKLTVRCAAGPEHVTLTITKTPIERARASVR